MLEINLIVDLAGLLVPLKLSMIDSVFLPMDKTLLLYQLLIQQPVAISGNVNLKDAMEVK